MGGRKKEKKYEKLCKYGIFHSLKRNCFILVDFWYLRLVVEEPLLEFLFLIDFVKDACFLACSYANVMMWINTCCFNIVKFALRHQVWDLGGQDRLRTSWATYYRGTHAVIAVIDSTDRARISVMKDELFRLLGHEDLQHSVVLVFANKQDLKDAMTPAEISDALSLHSIKNHDWHIQACCALTGEGLYDGLGWIAQRVTGKASS